MRLTSVCRSIYSGTNVVRSLWMFVLPSKGYTVYTKTNCPSCEKLKEVLNDARWVNCDEYLEDVEAFLEFMDSLSDGRAVKFPMVFFDGEFVDRSGNVKFNTTASF